MASDAGRDSFVAADVAPTDAAADALAMRDAAPDAPLDARADAGTVILSVDQSQLDFGSLDIGVAGEATLNLTNAGTGIGLYHMQITGDLPFGPSSTITTQSIGPNDTQQLGFSALTFATGEFTGTLTIWSDTWSVSLPLHAQSDTQLYVSTGVGGTVAAPPKYTGDLVLHAVPDAGYRFVSWSDPTCGTQVDCTLHQEAIGRSVRAYFAPTSSVMVNITLAGDAPITVRFDDTFTTDELAACRTSCSIPVVPGRAILVTAQSLYGDVTLSGACSGTTQCTLSTSTTTSLTASASKTAKDGWARELETTTLVSGRYDSQGNLIVLADAFDARSKQVIKLDAQGKTIWAHPYRQGRELSITSNDGVLVRDGNDLWWLDHNGYQLGDRYSLGPIGGSSVSDTHFQQRVQYAPGLLAVVGASYGVAVGGSSDSYADWTATAAVQSFHALAMTASRVYVAVANAAGGTDLLTFDYAGTPGPTLAAVAPHAATGVRVLSNGDLATISTTASQISVRRITPTSTVFARDIAVSDSDAPTASLVETSNGELFAVWAASAPVSGGAAGYVAALFDATGGVIWSVTRPHPATAYNDDVEVYDVASHGSSIAIIGSLLSISPDAGGESTSYVNFGAGFVQTFMP